MFAAIPLAACSAEQEAAPAGVEYDEITNGAHMSYGDASLCSVTAMSDAAGLYRVERMTGVREPDSRTGQDYGFTYVEISLEDGWTAGAPENEVLRIDGGPGADGEVIPWEVSLNKGQSYGMILAKATERSGGHRSIGYLGVFRKAREGYANDFYFPADGVPYDEVKTSVKSAFDGCAADVPYIGSASAE